MLALATVLMLQAADTPRRSEVTREAERCTVRNSIRTDVLTITRAPQLLVGRCVTVSGPSTGRSLYSGVEGLYLLRRFGPDGEVSKDALRHRIGVYTEESSLGEAARAWRGPALLTVTGRVDTCERIGKRVARRDRKYGSITMLAGYCHSNRGPVLRAWSYSVDTSRRYERLAGEDARRRFGNLIRLPSDWALPPLLVAWAEAFRSAVAAGDRRALADLHGVSPDPDKSDMLDSILDPNSPFRELRSRPSAQLALFTSFGTTRQAFADREQSPAVTVCFCRTRDCSNLWPISGGDADNSAERPYVCTRIESDSWASREVDFSTQFERAWLAEPAQTAFSRE